MLAAAVDRRAPSTRDAQLALDDAVDAVGRRTWRETDGEADVGAGLKTQKARTGSRAAAAR